MSPKPARKRTAFDAYDHLWPLLPVYIAFVAVMVFIGLTDLGPAPTSAGPAASTGAKS